MLNIGLYRSGVSLVAATVSDRLTAFRIEPELTVRVYGKPGDYLLLGGGLTYEALVRDRRSPEQGSEKSERHLFRPFLSTSIGAGIGQLRIAFWPLKPAPEVRIDIGFAIGR